MTPAEAESVADLASDIMRKSSPHQRDHLAKALAAHPDWPATTALDAIEQFAESNEFISVPGIFAILRPKVPRDTAAIGRAMDAEERRQREAAAKAVEDPSVSRAIAWATSEPPGRLEEFKEQLMICRPELRWLAAKPVTSLVWQCAMFAEFGNASPVGVP